MPGAERIATVQLLARHLLVDLDLSVGDDNQVMLADIHLNTPEERKLLAAIEGLKSYWWFGFINFRSLCLYVKKLDGVSMEGHDLSALETTDNDLSVTHEVMDIVRQLFVDNSEKIFIIYINTDRQITQSPDWFLIPPAGDEFDVKLSSGGGTLPYSPLNKFSPLRTRRFAVLQAK